MKPEYAAWIAEHVPANPTGMCGGVTQMMTDEFPELRRVRGHYYCPFWPTTTGDPHWWCVGPDGSIVDPTAAQFESNGAGEYVEHVDGSPEPTGKCLDCGGYTYGGATFCSPACEAATAAFMQREARRR